MSADEIDWQELNAYVDGELPVARASAIAEAIARDAALARQAALLSRLKAGVAASLELPDSLRRLPQPRRRPARAALAAAVALLLVLAGTLWLQSGHDGGERSAWLGEAAALHRQLAQAPADEQLSAGLLMRAAAPAFPGFPPDLSAAKLVAGSVLPISSTVLGSGAAVQYLGTRGCRVSLIALEEAGGSATEALQKTSGGELEVFRWRVGAIGYLLLAEGMDSGRLETIAETVYQASRRLRPIDETARTRLADSRQRSAPCRA